jgi:branched-chain amino acid transport system substrate-binding protein
MVKHSISTRAVVGLGLLAAVPVSARAADVYLPIVVPVTGFMSVAGGSQRNGAVMAAQNAPSGLKVEAPVFDTGTSASGAATALDKALSDKPALAASASVFGTETVAMVPVSADYKVPLLTISGLSKLTESGNKYVFRFLPNDREIKVAHARYVVDTLKAKKIALIGDTTA